MDSTIKNISQLETALAKMKKISESATNTPTISSPILTPQDATNSNIKTETENSDWSHLYPEPMQQRSIPRTSTSQSNTHGLLQNIAALQTSTNNKVDKLANAIYSLQNCMERTLKEQIKQTELLSTIARNTVAISNVSNSSASSKHTAKTSDVSIKEYGFNTNLQLLSEFIMKMLKQIQSQSITKGRQYRVTKDLNSQALRRIIDLAMKTRFKIDGILQDSIEAKGTKISAYVKVASRIGSGTEGFNPILTGQAFREIFDDSECGVFVRAVESIIERLSILKILIPYYEADIIASIEYPYFDKGGDAICDWSKVSPRQETKIETIAVKADNKQQEKIVKLLATGVSAERAMSALSAIIDNS